MKDLDEAASLPDRPRVVVVAVLAAVVAVVAARGLSRVRSPARELRKARSLWLKRARPYSSGTGGGGFGNASMRSWPVRAGGRRDVDADKEDVDGERIDDEWARWEWEWEWEWWREEADGG